MACRSIPRAPRSRSMPSCSCAGTAPCSRIATSNDVRTGDRMMRPLLCTLLLATLASPCALAQGDRQPPGVPRRADIERMVHDATEQARVVGDQARAFADYQRELAEAS